MCARVKIFSIRPSPCTPMSRIARTRYGASLGRLLDVASHSLEQGARRRTIPSRTTGLHLRGGDKLLLGSGCSAFSHVENQRNDAGVYPVLHAGARTKRKLKRFLARAGLVHAPEQPQTQARAHPAPSASINITVPNIRVSAEHAWQLRPKISIGVYAPGRRTRRAKKLASAVDLAAAVMFSARNLCERSAVFTC